MTWELAWKQTHIWGRGVRKTFKMGSRNPLKIYKNPSLHPKMSFLVLPGAPGSSHGPQGAKVEAPGLPNDKFWLQKWPHPLPKYEFCVKKWSQNWHAETNQPAHISAEKFKKNMTRKQTSNNQKASSQQADSTGEAFRYIHAYIWMTS